MRPSCILTLARSPFCLPDWQPAPEKCLMAWQRQGRGPYASFWPSQSPYRLEPLYTSTFDSSPKITLLKEQK